MFGSSNLNIALAAACLEDKMTSARVKDLLLALKQSGSTNDLDITLILIRCLTVSHNTIIDKLVT